MTRSAWDEAIEAYYDEHDDVLLDADAHGPSYLVTEAVTGVPAGVDPDDEPAPARLWKVTQTLADPAGHHDWVIEALVDLDASDELGELVLTTTAFRRL